MAYKAPFLPTRGAVRSAQPQGAVGIDWSNPITRGLVNTALPSSGTYIDVVGKSAFTPVGSPTVEASQAGVALKTVAASSQYGYFNTSVTNFPYTVLTLHIVDSSANGAHVSLGTVSGTDRAVLFYNATAYSSSFQGNSGGTDGTLAAAIGSPTVAGFRVDAAATGSLIVNGATNNGTTILLPQSLTRLYISARMSATAGVFASQRNALVMVWNRALSDAEVRSVCANPWQIFRNQALLAAPSIAPRAPVTPRQSFWMGTTSPTPSTASIAGLVNSTARTKQPTQGFSALNLSNDITKGIAAAVVPSAGYRELTGKQPIIVGGSGVGIYGNNSGSLSAGPFWAWPVGAVSSSTYTMLVVGEFAPTNGAILVSVANITGTGYKFCFSPTGGNIGITHYGTADYTFGVASPASGCIAVSGAANSTASLWVNGANLANIAVGGITAASSPAFSVGGRYNASDATSASKIYLAVLWNRVLSPAELASVTANPWQIFAPVAKPVWVKT